MRTALDAPPGDWALTAPPARLLPPDADGGADVIIAFFRAAEEITSRLPALADRVFPAGAIWALWPRRAGGHVSDITDNVMRSCALEFGLVDVKVAAVDADWSGLRLVWRTSNRLPLAGTSASGAVHRPACLPAGRGTFRDGKDGTFIPALAEECSGPTAARLRRSSGVVDGHVAFMNYARFEDEHDEGRLTRFRQRLASEVRAQTGQEFLIFQDREDISWGQNWQQRINETLDQVTLLLVVITPGLFHSDACRDEVARFRQRERQQGRSDLILPVYYIAAREMEDPAARRSDDLAVLLASRHYADWRKLRFEPMDSPATLRAFEQLAIRTANAFSRTGPPDPYARFAKDPVTPWVPHAQRQWAQLSQPLPSAPWPPPAARSSAARRLSAASPAHGAAVRVSAANPGANPAADDGADRPPRPAGGHGKRPADGHGKRWRPSRRALLAAGAAALVLAAAGTFYAVAAPRPGPTLAATLTVPGGDTVDTVWISPDGKRIAGARSNQPSEIYVWNTGSPAQAEVFTPPPIRVGTTDYPMIIENIAFSADDSSVTAVGYPGAAVSEQTYVLYRWDLADSRLTTPWSVAGTSSLLSFSGDNSTAVKALPGAVSLVSLGLTPMSSSPFKLPDGNALSDSTTYALDLNGKRMLYSPQKQTYKIWDFTKDQVIYTFNSVRPPLLSPAGQTLLVFYSASKGTASGPGNATIAPGPVLWDIATHSNITPTDPRWQQQLVSSTLTQAFATFSTDGSVITTKRPGGKTDLWNASTSKYLLTITDPTYRDDGDYAVAGPGGREVVLFGGRTTSTENEYRQLYVWDTP